MKHDPFSFVQGTFIADGLETVMHVLILLD